MRWNQVFPEYHEEAEKFLWLPKKLPVGNHFGKHEWRWLEKCKIMRLYPGLCFIPINLYWVE